MDTTKIIQREGQTYYVVAEPTQEELTLFPLPVNFKVIDIEAGTYKIVSFKADGTRLELTTGNGGSENFIPLTGTEEGKPVTGDIELLVDSDYNHAKLKFKNYNPNAGEGENYVRYSADQNALELASENIDSTSKSAVFIDPIAVEIQSDYFAGSVKNFHLRGHNGLSEFNSTEGNKFNIVGAASEGFRGLGADDYYGANLSDTDYTQKKYVDASNSYSTEETKTGGTWIDGKHIYRKVFTGVLEDATDYSYYQADGTSYMDVVVNEHVFIKHPEGTNNVAFIDEGENDSNTRYLTLRIDIDSDSLAVASTSANAGKTVHIILEYTKTD